MADHESFPIPVPVALGDAISALADAIARRVTETVPRTTSYRSAVAIAAAHVMADHFADAERARAFRAAVNDALDSA